MKNGFTLLELIIVLGIIIILFGLAFNMLDVTNLGWDTQNVQVELQQEARRGLDSMLGELYQTNTTQVNLEDINGDGTFGAVSFRVPVVITGDTDIYTPVGNIRWGAVSNENFRIRYSVNQANRQLIREILDAASTPVPGSSSVCANNVQSLILIPGAMPPETLLVRIISQKPIRPGSNRQLSATFESRITFRN